MAFHQIVQIHWLAHINQVHPWMATPTGSPPNSEHFTTLSLHFMLTGHWDCHAFSGMPPCLLPTGVEGPTWTVTPASNLAHHQQHFSRPNGLWPIHRAKCPNDNHAPPPTLQSPSTSQSTGKARMETAILWATLSPLAVCTTNPPLTNQWHHVLFKVHQAHLASSTQIWKIQNDHLHPCSYKQEDRSLLLEAAVHRIFNEAQQDPILQTMIEHIEPEIGSLVKFANGLLTVTTTSEHIAKWHSCKLNSACPIFNSSSLLSCRITYLQQWTKTYCTPIADGTFNHVWA